MGIAAAHALQLGTPPRTPKAGNPQVLARRGGDTPARYRRGALGNLVRPGSAPEHESRDAGSFGGKLEPLGRRRRIFADLADHAGQTRIAQAFFHREQHVRIAARFDMDHPVGMQAGEMQGRGEQVAPAQAPENRSLDPGKDAGEEDRRAGIVGEFRTAGYLVERAGCDAAPRQPRIQRIDAERDCAVADARALDLRDTRSQIFKDSDLVHGIRRLVSG